MAQSSAADSPRMDPQKIGNYRIIRLIGEGGMGRVYEAIHDQIERRAAIKVLHAQFAHNSEAYTRFLNEARAVNIVHHPGVVNVFEFGQTEDGSPYIVMEYLEGESLSARLERLKFMSLGSLRIARQIASALVAAHAKHIVHRDLKPSNIMLVPDPDVPGGERVKVVDFGIAKMSSEHHAGSSKTRAGAILGTPLYMSPEQCRGAGDVTAQSDVYSLGVMIYEMLCGHTPFNADGEGEVMGMHLFHAPPPLHLQMPTLPLDLVNLVHTMLAKAPEQRPTMADVAHELDRIGQKLSDQSHSASPELAAFIAAPPPPGPKTIPLTDGAQGSAEVVQKSAAVPAAAAGEAAVHATTPTLTAPPSGSAVASAAPPPALAQPAESADFKSDTNGTPLLAAEKQNAAPPEKPPVGPRNSQTGELPQLAESKRRWLKVAIPAGVALALGGVALAIGLSRSPSRPVPVAATAPPVSSAPLASVAVEGPRPLETRQTPPPIETEAAAVSRPAVEPAAPTTQPPAVEPGKPGAAPAPVAPATPIELAPGTIAGVKGPLRKTDSVVALAEQYVRGGEWAAALHSAKTWGEQSANPALMRRIVGVSACHLKQVGEVLSVYDKLKGEDRQAVVLACRVAGVTIPDEALSDAERLLAQKSWAEAIAAAQSPQLPRPLPARAWRVIGIASCRLRDFKRANDSMVKLDAKDRAAVEAVCRKTRPEKPIIF